MRSVAELVAESETLGSLARYAEPGGSIPLASDAQELWKYFATKLLPAIAESRAPPTSAGAPGFLRDFKRVQALALAAQINDFSLQDYLEPHPERWATQMTQINAFYEFSQAFRDQLEPELSDLYEATEKLELYRGSITETQRRRDELSRNFELSPEARRAEVARQRAELEMEVAQKTSQLHESENLLHNEIEPQAQSVQNEVKELQQLHETHVENIELLHELLDDTNSSSKNSARAVEELQRNVRELQREQRALEDAMIKKYEPTMQMMKRFKCELEELKALKEAAQAQEAPLKTLEGTVSQATLRRDRAKQELNAKLRELELATTRRDNLKREVDEQLAKLAKLRSGGTSTTNTKSNRTRDEIELDEQTEAALSQAQAGAQARFDSLQAANNELQRRVTAQRRWLKDMTTLEQAGVRLVEEIEVVKNWMRAYLGNANATSKEPKPKRVAL